MDEVLDMVRDYHCVFGEGLMRKWDLGDHFCYVTRHHHDLEKYRLEDEETADVRKKMHVVNLADQLVIYAGAGYYAKGLPSPGLSESYEALDIGAEVKDNLRHRTETMFGELFA